MSDRDEDTKLEQASVGEEIKEETSSAEESPALL